MEEAVVINFFPNQNAEARLILLIIEKELVYHR